MAKGDDLKDRTQRFSLSVIRGLAGLERSPAADIIQRQLIRSATSVGANYRSACRAKSKADFAAKIAIVIEECDEAQYWLELLHAMSLVPTELFTALHSEANELVSIFVSSRKTAVEALGRKS